MSPGHLHSGIAVDIGQEAQTEALRVGGVREAVHSEGRLWGMECLPHPLVQLIVGYGAPEGRLWIGHRLQIYNKAKKQRPHLWNNKTNKK